MLAENLAKSLAGIRVLTLAVNLPGPAAAARLHGLGAEITKVEPPTGDPLEGASPAWYRALVSGQQVLQLDIKDTSGRAEFERLLERSDLLLTAVRPAALDRLALGWPSLHGKIPRLCQVAIVGFPPPQENVAGHDLIYQAKLGLVTPPALPRTLLADLAGAERVVSVAVALLFARERGHGSGYAQVSLLEAAEPFADPLRYRMTSADGLLGGNAPGYNLYRARDGWVAIAALEPHFWERLEAELNLERVDRKALERVFLTRSAQEWQQWATARDLPIAALPAEP